MSSPRVLVATTVYDGKDYVFNRWWRRVRELNYPNYDILVVDNSATDDYYRKLKRRGVPVAKVPRGKHSREGVANASNYIRNRVLEGNYEYWMSIESDLIPPRNIIQRLMAHGRLSVGCLYVIGYAASPDQPMRPCLFETRRNEIGELETYNLPPHEGFGMFGTGLQKIHGCGLGCTLMHRTFLEKYRFWYVDNMIKHSDVFLYMDLHNNCYEVFVDTDIIIPHYNSNWNEVKDI